MAIHEVEKGLDLPIAGAPIQVIRETARKFQWTMAMLTVWTRK